MIVLAVALGGGLGGGIGSVAARTLQLSVDVLFSAMVAADSKLAIVYRKLRKRKSLQRERESLRSSTEALEHELNSLQRKHNSLHATLR